MLRRWKYRGASYFISIVSFVYLGLMLVGELRNASSPSIDRNPVCPQKNGRISRQNILPPDLNLESFSLDAVITYVNGSDPVFLKSLRDSIQQHGLIISFAVTENRFHDHDDLKILLRSIEKYGKIFRFIFLVLSGPTQVPIWLDQNHPQLKIVYHKDIWQNPATLPVFNSLAIELNLHHISGLSNYFVYFNDDLTITNELQVEDFCWLDTCAMDGVLALKIRPDISIPSDYVVSKNGSDSHWVGPALLTQRLMNNICGPIGYNQQTANGYIPSHTPHLLIRSVLYAAENDERIRDSFTNVTSSHFRSGTEINTVMLFNSYAQCVLNHTAVWAPRSELVYIGVNTAVKDLTYLASMRYVTKVYEDRIRQGLIKFLCLNDVSDSGLQTPVGRKTAAAAYEWRASLFPEKSAFEL